MSSRCEKNVDFGSQYVAHTRTHIHRNGRIKPTARERMSYRVIGRRGRVKEDGVRE